EEEMTGRHLSDLWGKETYKNIIAGKLQTCFSGQTVRYQADFNVGSSGEKYFEVTFYPLKNQEGEIVNVLAESLDITELKLSVREAIRKEEDIKRLEMTVPVGLLRCKPDGTIVRFNDNFMKLIECDNPDLLTGVSFREFYSEKSLFDIHLMQLQKGEIRTFSRVPLVTLNNREIKCRINGCMVSDYDNPHDSWFDFAFEDVSREVMLENRLLQAKKLETIGSLAGGIAHDFNNLLGSILGFTEMLGDELKDNKSAFEITGKILKAGTRAKELTNQLLTFSRQVEQKKVPVCVNDILEEAVSVVSSHIKTGMTVRERIESSKVMVSADPTQLFRVFLNLMTNAVQAMEKNGGTLTVTLELADGLAFRNETGKENSSDRYALVRIEDTGTGMEDAVISRIFEPYFTTKEPGKGTGLGLSVVYGIVSDLEGELAVKSEKGRGSVFSVFIPAITQSTEQTIINTRDSVRIMFVSGDSHESRILAGALRQSGYTVHNLRGKDEFMNIGIDSLEKINIIVYVCEEGVISQSDFYAKFVDDNLNIPVIFIAGSQCDISAEKLLNSGIAKHVLFKPVSLREIITAIQLI
ncbi:MAG: PAS domain-containing protein, partial [Bacteroidales bacterium]|nr:PAS domain-containing protein [Bacteroidales bacterium]